jgi:CheY-like chemotaxis protein
MDLKMPGMDGYTAIREIRRMETQARRARTPIVVVSAHTRDWERAEVRAAGGDFHLAKPISVPALLGTVEAAVTAL